MRLRAVPGSLLGAQLNLLLRRQCATNAKGSAAGGAGVEAYIMGRSGGAAAAAEGGSPLPPGFGRPELSPGRRFAANFFRIVLPLSGAGMMWYAYTHPDQDALVGKKYPPELQYLAAMQTPNTDTLTNWSGTHEATPPRYFHPDSESDVAAFLAVAERRRERLRPVGSGLSPNGAGLSGEGVLALGGLDRILSISREDMTVTVQAGCRVQQVADALAPHGLTLQNYASIREQQIGGITQVGAHGTGPRIPPVDEQVVAMRLVSPALGPMSLSEQEEPELFKLARVGLGSLGVMTQATLRVVPSHQLIERTFTASTAEVRKNHVRWLKENRHIKYLFIPSTDTVVVVQANPATSAEELRVAKEQAAHPQHAPQQRTEALRRLYASVAPPSAAEGLTAPQLRDALLASGPGPLDARWVGAVNAAEAEFWRRSAGVRVGASDEVLGFDCGGQQWVLEVAFPVAKSLEGLRAGARTADLEFIEALQAEIARARIPAPAPIEMRWTSGSSSPLSPAHGPPESLHCWVGVIMYLPDQQQQREAVTTAFREYARLVERKLMKRFNATWHWAKLETQGRGEAELAEAVRPRLRARFGPALAALGRYRAVLDPEGVLGNEWLDSVLGNAPRQAAAKQ